MPNIFGGDQLSDEYASWFHEKIAREKKQKLEERCYISVDVETSGPIPGEYSMIALGACIVGDDSKKFYVELKPLNKNYQIDAMRIGCKGLNCLEKYSGIEIYNPASNRFNPEKVVDELYLSGIDTKQTMQKFQNWIYDVSAGREIVEVAAPIKFDGMFTQWYFHKFLKENPLGHSGIDMNSIYRGITRNFKSNIKDLNLRKGNLTHNALEDAIVQAKEFEAIIMLM